MQRVFFDEAARPGSHLFDLADRIVTPLRGRTPANLMDRLSPMRTLSLALASALLEYGETPPTMYSWEFC